MAFFWPRTAFSILITLLICHQDYSYASDMCPLEGKSLRKTQLFNLRFPNYTVSMPALTLYDCVSNCDTNRCISFGYSTLKGICYLYDRRVLYGEASTIFEEGMVNYWTVEESCPVDYTFASAVNLCYKVVYTSLNHSMANGVCVADGGHLIILDTPAKRDYLLSQHAYSLDQFLVGGHQEAVGESWAWFNGAPITNWRIFQPDNWDIEDCLNLSYVNAHDYLGWKTITANDVGCDIKIKFICEIPVSP